MSSGVVQRVEVRGDCFFDDNSEIVAHYYKAFFMMLEFINLIHM